MLHCSPQKLDKFQNYGAQPRKQPHSIISPTIESPDLKECMSILSDLKVEDEYYYGWVDSIEKLQEFEDNFRIVAGVKFNVRSSTHADVK